MFPCELKEQAAQPTLSIRFRAPVQELPQHFGRIYGAIGAYLEALGEHHTGGVFAAYYNMDMQNLDIEAGFTVSKPLSGKGEIRASSIPGGTYAICHYTGPYDGTGPAYEALTQFVKDKGYKLGGVFYEWYLNGPETPPQDLKTDLACPVTRMSEHIGV
jgi:effector-binding domain-containing protein